MNILNLSSQDIPYRDTNYQAFIVGPITAVNELNPTRIRCELVQVKEFEDMTYFKFTCTYGITFSSEKDLQITIQRDDDRELIMHLPITNNIVAVMTKDLKWKKMTKQELNTVDRMQETLQRLYQPDLNTRPGIPFYDPVPPNQWIRGELVPPMSIGTIGTYTNGDEVTNMSVVSSRTTINSSDILSTISNIQGDADGDKRSNNL